MKYLKIAFYVAKFVEKSKFIINHLNFFIMKKMLKLFMFMTMFGIFSFSIPAYGQDPITIILNPVKPGGLGGDGGNSKTPEELTCPLSLYYSETIDQLEFENIESSPVTFTYYIFDEDDNTVDYGTICINGNTSYLLYLNSIIGETYRIQIIVDNIVYEGYFGQ